MSAHWPVNRPTVAIHTKTPYGLTAGCPALNRFATQWTKALL